MKIRRAYAIAQKEVYHILRDPFTLALALMLPVMMVTIFGLAIEFNVKNIHIAYYDADQSQASRRLIEVMSSSHYFLMEPVRSPKAAIEHVDSEQDRAALIINPQFESDVLSGRGAKAQVIVDGSDSSTIGSILNYIGQMSQIASRRIAGFDPPVPIKVKTRFLFNPELDSRWFTVPGLLVVVVSILAILLTSLTVAREWENGSMELLLSTPVEPVEIIIGKLSPYVGLGLGAVFAVYFVARAFLGVPFVGSHWVFLLGCLLFLTTYLALGLLISVLTRKQQLAMQFSMMAGLLPATLLSGFIFPIKSMPMFFQYFTMLLPARWFMNISRAVFLKGSGLMELKGPFLALIIAMLVSVTLAARNFKKDVEP